MSWLSKPVDKPELCERNALPVSALKPLETWKQLYCHEGGELRDPCASGNAFSIFPSYTLPPHQLPQDGISETSPARDHAITIILEMQFARWQSPSSCSKPEPCTTHQFTTSGMRPPYVDHAKRFVSPLRVAAFLHVFNHFWSV